MFASFLHIRRGLNSGRANRGKSIVERAAAVTIEDLEARRLLSTVTFTAASTSVNSAAANIYLEPSQTVPFEVEVHYGSPTGFLAYTFTGASDTDSIVSPSAGVTFHQQVPAVAAPFGGIQVSAGSGGTLQVDAGDTDQLIQLIASTTSSGTIRSEDSVNSAQGDSIYGAGISHLVIRTNDVAGSSTADGTVVNVSSAGAGSFFGSSLPGLSVATSLLIDTGAGTYDTINIGGGENTGASGVVVTTGAGNDTVNVTSDDDVDATSSANIDFGPGTGGGLGLENTLNVTAGGAATLAYHTPTSHTVVVDNVYANSSGTYPGYYPASVIVSTPTTIGTAVISYPLAALEVDAASTINSLDVAAGATATFTAAATLGSANVESGSTATFTGTAPSTIGDFTDDGAATIEAAADITNLTGSGTAEFTGTAGSSTIYTVDHTGNITVDSGATVTVVGHIGAGSVISTFNTLTVAGDVYLQSGSTVSDLEQSAGLVKLDQSGTWRDTAFANTFSTINITGGQLDVNGQDVLTDTDLSTIVGDLTSAYNSGTWTGSGITSSYAIGTPSHYAVGYATDADNTATGLSLSSGVVLIRPARVGDADLSGTTGLSDYNLLATNFNHTGTDWAQGNFNYDSGTNLTDYNDLSLNFNQSFPT